MAAMQALPYEVKVRRAEQRAYEFIEELDRRGMSAHVSVGGLDSITLLVFLRHIGIDVPAISVSALEDKSIQRVHRHLGVIPVVPGKSKVEVLNEVGFPVISKRIAGKIDTLQNPTEKNKTVRHAIITGECGAQGHYAKNSRMKLPQKWLNLFAGYENENEGVNYQIAPFKVSNKCCLYMKEQPCDRWAKEHNSRPFLGLMASEGGQREEALTEHGCNYFGKGVIRSAPFAPFLRQDLLQLALDLEVPIPEIYGRIERAADGTLYTTGHSGRDAACADLEFIWKNGHTDSISFESGIPRNGNSGCTGAVRTRIPERSMDGDECWTILVCRGRMIRKNRTGR